MNFAQLRILLPAIALASAFSIASAAAKDDAKKESAAPQVTIASLPKLHNGLPAYPPPMMAIGRTPHIISPLSDKTINIQSDFGYPGGFSGFVDAATGQIGYPGYRNFTNLDIAYDADKLCLLVSMPYPYGRKTRANATGPAELMADDVFEVLIDPRDEQGRSKGPIYRVIGNAGGICRVDRDFPQIGQPHQPWHSWSPGFSRLPSEPPKGGTPAPPKGGTTSAGVKYGSMMWDPQGSWMAAVQIPFADLGGPPRDGDTWGLQMALRYADPKITAVLSPSDDFTDAARFARVRFDAARRANYRCHWLSADEIQKGEFCVGGIFSNGANEPVKLAGHVTLYQGDKEIGHGDFAHAAKPLSTYDGDMPNCRFASHPASDKERDTVARVVVVDEHAHAVIYDQFIPYWTPPAGERDWLKQHFAKEFTFLIGPYPTQGAIDYSIDCQTLKEAIPSAARALIAVGTVGSAFISEEHDLPSDGKLSGTIEVGKFGGINLPYDMTATILSKDGKTIGTKNESFTRHVQPFEKSPHAGVGAVAPHPFTKQTLDRDAASCIGRVYRNGEATFLKSIFAANEELLVAPVAFKVKIGEHGAIAMSRSEPTFFNDRSDLTDPSKPRAVQSFSGGNIALIAGGDFDYDGFYHFGVAIRPVNGPVDLRSFYLEIPLRGEHARMIEAPVEWMWKDWEQSTGMLSTKQGRLWDSKRFPFAVRQRKGNMPPFCWVGDDERGLCFSCASDEGMHNDDALPAVTVDREGKRVVMRIWFVNKPLKLDEPRVFDFALQASPFKPLDANHRLWRCGVTRNECVYGNRAKYFHTGWGIGDYWPTYGRCLDLKKNAEAIEKVRASGYDYIAASASSCSECGGTPEYKQFWREWGSELGWDKQQLGPLPDWMEKHMKDSGVPFDRYVSVESASNACRSNIDYRAWWFDQVARHCQTSMIYQDNPPYGYYYQPAVGYGYTRDDGVKEPTCATWNQREFMKRALAIAVESGTDNPAPGVYPNVCGSSQPGRSFCFRGLTGEYLESDKLPLGMLRVWLSKQWGMNIDWLFQEPNAGATMKYWRALCSRLFLLDVTSFAREDSADQSRSWLAALDLFWLDDPTIVWHPYYRNPTVKSAAPPTTLVSTYTAKGRALFIVSNQGTDDVVESVRLNDLAPYGAGGAKYFYDVETAEEIGTAADGALRMFIPASDYRLVLAFDKPWPFAAKNALHMPDLAAQSALDSRPTLTALCQQLLVSPHVAPVENGHRLTEAWVTQVVAEMKADPAGFVYLDKTACADVDLGDRHIETALLYDKKRELLLAVYFNPTDTDRLLKGTAREALNRKVGRSGYPYVLDPIRGISQWNVIDLPAGRGKLELLYSDAADYGGLRRGSFAQGTMWTNLRLALEARKKEMGK